MSSLSSLRENSSGKQQKAKLRDTGSVCLARNSIVRAKLLYPVIGYKKKDDERHKDMHSLVGVFIKSDKEE